MAGRHELAPESAQINYVSLAEHADDNYSFGHRCGINYCRQFWHTHVCINSNNYTTQSRTNYLLCTYPEAMIAKEECRIKPYDYGYPSSQIAVHAMPCAHEPLCDCELVSDDHCRLGSSFVSIENQSISV